MSETWKTRWKFTGIGAAAGAGLLLLFWLLGDVAHIIGLTLSDSAFFLGLVLFLVGLLMIVRGGPTSKYVAGGRGRIQAAINPSLAMQEEPKQPKAEKKVNPAPCVCMGAGVVNLLVYAVFFLLYFI